MDDVRVEFSEKAERLIIELVDAGADDILISKLMEELHRIAEAPTQRTRTASYPHPPRFLSANFSLLDEEQHRWGFDVLLTRTQDEMGIIVQMIRGHDYGLDSNA